MTTRYIIYFIYMYLHNVKTSPPPIKQEKNNLEKNVMIILNYLTFQSFGLDRT